MLESILLNLGTGLAVNFLPGLLTKLIPTEVIQIFGFVSDDTKKLITKGMKAFDAYAKTTPNDTTWGKLDNVLAAIGVGVAKATGLWLESAEEEPAMQTNIVNAEESGA